MAGSALIVVDMLNRYDHADAEPLAASVRDRLPAMRSLLEAATEHDVLTVWVNDNDNDWSANAPSLTSHAMAGYVRHFEVVVAPDAVAHIHDDLARAALRMMEINMRARLVDANQVAFTTGDRAR